MMVDGEGRLEARYEWGVPEVISFIRRNALWIVGPALAAALAVVVVFVFLLQRTYTASAILVIVPPALSSELKPPTLTVQGYQKLAESDAVIHEAQRRLRERGGLSASRSLRLGVDLETRIFVSRREETTSLAPMVQLVARELSPEQASAVANEWAAVSMERIGELNNRTTSATVSFIEEQYPMARDRLTGLEKDRLGLAARFADRQASAAERWSRRIIEIDATTRDEIARLQQSKQEELDRFANERRLMLRKADLQALKTTYGDYSNEQVRLEARIEREKDKLKAAQELLARTSPTIELRKAPSDEVTWQAAVAGKARLEDISDKVLVTQEINPLYVSLAGQVATAEMEVDSLEPRRAQLSSTLARMEQSVADLEAAIDEDERRLQALSAAADARIARKKAERETVRAEAESERDLAIQALKRESETRLGQAGRDIQKERVLFDQLATKFNEALLVKGQQNFEDVRLGTQAVPPDRADPARFWQATVIAVFVGLIIGLGVAAFREVGRPARDDAGKGDEARA